MTADLEQQRNVLHKLAELEESVGHLYETYAGLFPDYQEFWLALVAEEKQYTAWVKELESYLTKGTVKFNEGRFNVFAIQSFLNYLKDEAEKAPGRTILNALSISAYVEESLMERGYFDVVDGDSEALKLTLNNLAEATQKHIKRVREYLNTYRNSNNK
jgi:hypothetical protein